MRGIWKFRVGAGALAALALAFCALTLFAWLGLEVYRGETLRFDDQVRTMLHRHASPMLTMVMRAFTFIGAPLSLFVLVAAAILALWNSGLRDEARFMTIALAGSLALEVGLKQLFHRARPEPYFNTPLPASYSFPSGHAIYAICLYGMLAALVSPRAGTRAAKMTIWITCSLIILLIGVSRIYLGVHYPSDVIAGYASALVWVIGLRRITDWIGRRSKRTMSS